MSGRIMFAGANSGCGKTTITCTVLQYLHERYQVKSYKCGPDYIDPMFHKKVLGIASGNLDLYLTSENIVKYLMAEGSAGYDLSVIEGVMGLYDGKAGGSFASSNHLSIATKTPVVLVVNGKGMAFSILAMIKGYLTFMPNQIKGVILNRTTGHVYDSLKEEIKKLGITPLGYMPEMPDAVIQSRHLGLVTADEIGDLHIILDRLKTQAEKSIDFGGILQIAQDAPPLTYDEVKLPAPNKPVQIGIAYDRAFCFYYSENIMLLEKMGAEMIYFSPLDLKALPENLDGLILGGGYPELYLKELSQNTDFLADLREKLEQGLPCIAECGGFMYLLDCVDGYPLTGFIPGAASLQKKLVRFGYVELTAQCDNLLCKKGESIFAHEFHYSDSNNNGSDFTASKNSSISYPCIHATKSLYAGYPHLNLWGNTLFAENFVAACAAYQKYNGGFHGINK